MMRRRPPSLLRTFQRRRRAQQWRISGPRIRSSLARLTLDGVDEGFAALDAPFGRVGLEVAGEVRKVGAEVSSGLRGEEETGKRADGSADQKDGEAGQRWNLNGAASGAVVVSRESVHRLR